ncbi:MAG: Gfo/Idh/MocA family oxidoreductase [Clostridia bacterium]|nr:Gfo/Idh/MocA family oxidoreductase [Clostridia bacterium]
MRKIRVAQIGTSEFSHGSAIFGALVKCPDVFEIVGYALPEGEREKFPRRMKRFEGYKELTVEEILADESIEAVIIETEEIYLTKYALMAAKAGKHIHMEKPGGLSLSDFEELMSIVKKNGTVFHTGYMYRYNPAIADVIKRVKEGEIGEVVSVEAQMNCLHGVECVSWLSTFPGGMMFFLGCHMIDLVLQIQGEPKAVIPFNRSSKRFEGVDSKDNGFAVLEYDRGASFVKTSGAEHCGFERRQLVVTGTKGRFEIRPLEMAAGAYPLHCTDYNKGTGVDWKVGAEWTRSENYDRYIPMMKSFAEMVAGEKENPYTCDYELMLFKTILKCCE